MRKVIIAVVSLSMVFLFSICAFATETTAVTRVSTETTETTNSILTTQDDKETSVISFGEVIKNALSSITTYISIAGFLLVGIFMIFFNQEVPKRIATLTPFIMLVLLLIARIFVYLPHADISITIYVMVLYILGIIWYKKIISSSTPIKEISDVPVTVNSIEKKAINSLGRLLKQSHGSIKCIQIYSVEKERLEKYTEYTIKFIGGQVRPQFNVNALFSSIMCIENEYLDEMNAVKRLYTSFVSDGQLTYDEQKVILGLINEKIVKLQNKLNNISSIDSITAHDCYVARILLVYLSLKTAIEQHGCFIGLGTNSLGLNNPEIETRLFNYKRTGILGSILYENTPYVFSYMKSNDKNGRFYYAFNFGTKKNYIMTLTLTNKDRNTYISQDISNSIDSIKNDLGAILKPIAIERDENDDKKQK